MKRLKRLRYYEGVSNKLIFCLAIVLRIYQSFYQGGERGGYQSKNLQTELQDNMSGLGDCDLVFHVDTRNSI